jgi:imidazolonepropionase-like amidohydrolase
LHGRPGGVRRRTLSGMTITVLRADRLFDGTGAAPVDHPTVVIDGQKIVSVRAAEVPADATVVDLPGATLLPGLVDTHVHLAFDASPDPVAALAGRDAAATFAAMCAAARVAARAGVTTVRDLGDVDYLALGVRAAARTDRTLPEVVAAGVPITTPGGHCHFLGGAVSGVDGVRAAVRDRHDRGVDVIKVMASGGNMTPGSRPETLQFSAEELRALVEEAHTLGLRVAAHAHGAAAVIAAVAAGVDSVEHASFITSDAVEDIPDGLLEEINRRGVALSLTLGLRLVEGVAMPPVMAARLPKLTANATEMCASGARVVVGTDAGIGPVKPHDVLPTALVQLIQLGMAPAEALHAITGRAAEVVGLGGRKGHVLTGYDADILAVDGDPLRDPSALHRIRAVYVRGAALAAVPA